MTREILPINLPEAQLEAARSAYYDQAEGLQPENVEAFREIGRTLLGKLFEADKGKKAQSEYIGNFKYWLPHQSNNNIVVCPPSPVTDQIIEAAQATLNSEYGGLHGSAVVNTLDPTKTPGLKTFRDGEEAVLFVNWGVGENDESYERKEQLAKDLFSTSVSAPLHVVIVPQNEGAIDELAEMVNSLNAPQEAAVAA